MSHVYYGKISSSDDPQKAAQPSWAVDVLGLLSSPKLAKEGKDAFVVPAQHAIFIVASHDKDSIVYQPTVLLTGMASCHALSGDMIALPRHVQSQ